MLMLLRLLLNCDSADALCSHDDYLLYSAKNVKASTVYAYIAGLPPSSSLAWISQHYIELEGHVCYYACTSQLESREHSNYTCCYSTTLSTATQSVCFCLLCIHRASV
jgi:hypothetical protein